MSFLPENYQVPKKNTGYLKFGQGTTKFRILSNSITGWIDWKDKKPIRSKNQKEIMIKSLDPSKVKHFWSFVVWDYNIKL